MAKTDANPPMMPYTDDYQLVEVDAEYLNKAVKPKQFIHIDQSECIMCEGCVDICPWKCIFMVNPDAITESSGTELPGEDPSDKVGVAPATGETHMRTNNHGYSYGMRF
jgi:formate hydrogenlyase subunit 6/NADH:ubiquinone oxidoreductase subunit I